MKRIAFFICFSSSFVTWAQQKDTADLEPVEVRAVRAAATAPFAKTNISKSQIQQQNLGQDLPILLNQTPSAVVNSDAGNGVGYTGIHIRGTDATRINVTLNGIPYNDAESQGTYFVDLPDFASSVNSIQIQRGVGTSTNGPGAFGATINFSSNEVNKKAYAEFNNSYGSFNTWKNTIKVGTGLLGNHFVSDLRLSRISSDGYVDRASSDLKSIYFSTAYLSNKTDLRLNVFSGKEKTYQVWNGIPEAKLRNDSIGLQEHYDNNVGYLYLTPADKANLFNSNPRKYNYFTYPNQTDNYRQDHYQLFFTLRFTPSLSFNAAVFLSNGKGYYEEYKVGQAYGDYGLTPPTAGMDTTDLVRRLWLDNHYYGTIFSVQHLKGKTSLIFGGAATRYDGGHYGEVIWAEKGLNQPQKYYDLNARKKDLNFYGKWQQDLTSRLQFFADMQYRHVHYDVDGFEAHPDLFINQSYDFFNPKFGLSYHQHNWLLYSSYSIASKEPNRDDFEASQSNLPKPERLNDLEAGIENKSSHGSFGADVYYMKYKNQLVLTGKINDVGSYTRTNIDDSYRLGLELQGSLTPAKWIRASANLTLSKNKVRNFKEYIDDYDNGGQKMNVYPESDISFSPKVVGAADLSFIPADKFALDVLAKYVGKQYLDNTSNEQRKLHAYYTQDLRARYSFSHNWLKNVDLIFQVNNLFNTKYEANGYTYSSYYNNQLVTENFYFPMAGINWMAGINIRL
ncbi:MAG: TonB-dependent receptor [Flavisolibacter sp.]